MFKIIEKNLKKRLSKKRFEHTQSVVDTALKIFQSILDNKKNFSEIIQLKINLNNKFKDKVALAALLHDSCKELSSRDQLSLAKFYGIKIDSVDKDFPNLLHARVGAKWIEDQYDIVDPYILKAVEEHTLGGINMLLSSKIIFLADAIEPLRGDDEHLSKIRKLIFKEHKLDQALLRAMDSKIFYMLEENKLIHPLSIKSRNYLLECIKVNASKAIN